MTFYDPNAKRQQVEILRRFSAEIPNDPDSDRYDPYTHTEEIEDTLKELFFSHHGITSIALYFGCPEISIMKKILSMDLYSRYDELVQHLRKKYRALYSESCDGLFLPYSQCEKDIETLRRSTSMYPHNQFKSTEDKRHMVFFLFKMGEDITNIALLLGCTEWMVMQKFMDDGRYSSWDTPWFAYSDQWCRDKFIDDCKHAKII